MAAISTSGARPSRLPGIQDGKHTLADGTYEFLKPWYERALKLQDDGIIPTYASLKTSNTHYSGPFYNQQIAMLPMGSWFIGTQIAKVAAGESLAKHWGIVDLPASRRRRRRHHGGGGDRAGRQCEFQEQGSGAGLHQASCPGPKARRIVAKTGTIPALHSDDVIQTIASKPGFPSDPASARGPEGGQGLSGNAGDAEGCRYRAGAEPGA